MSPFVVVIGTQIFPALISLFRSAFQFLCFQFLPCTVQKQGPPLLVSMRATTANIPYVSFPVSYLRSRHRDCDYNCILHYCISRLVVLPPLPFFYIFMVAQICPSSFSLSFTSSSHHRLVGGGYFYGRNKFPGKQHKDTAQHCGSA
jgi:hypothetical protein